MYWPACRARFWALYWPGCDRLDRDRARCLGGAFGFGAVGAFWGASSRLPVNEDAYDIALRDALEPAAIEVKLLSESSEAGVLDKLRSCHVKRIERRA